MNKNVALTMAVDGVIDGISIYMYKVYSYGMDYNIATARNKLGTSINWL